VNITRIAYTSFRIPFIAPYETARGTSTRRFGVIVRLETDAGVEGLGEASLDPSAPEGEMPGVIAAVEALARDLLRDGPDVLEDVPTGDDAARAAHFALETALTDAGAKAQGVPVAQLLAAHFSDGPQQTAVRVNATIASRHIEEAAVAALRAKAAGFGTVKLKVGMESSLEAEVERVRTLREVIGPDIRLRLDANGAWDESTAIATILALEPYDIELIEQPAPATDLDALGRVRAAVTTSIAADEAVVDYASAEIALRRADFVVLKPMRLGALSVAAYVAQHALAAERGVIVTTTIDSGVATAAALHLAASLPDEGRAHGLATASLLESDLLAAPLAVKRGVMSLPEAPGLGVTLDDAALERYTDGWHEVVL
jgi:L-alanine-DL-glutamate epimerase-like enolase superfamily enzyme